MVRETRHLWVGNLPENISEDRIREHFKRYGPVQSVKVVSGGCDDGVCAAVAFVDICSAAKAHKADHRMEERLLKTTYYEPSLTSLSTSHYPSAGSSLHREPAHYSSAGSQANSHVPHGARSPRFSTGLSEEHNSYEPRSSHFYESRRDETIGYNTSGGPSLAGGPVGSGVQSGMRRGGYPGDREADFVAGGRGRVRSYPPRGHFLTNGRAEPGDYRWGGGTQYRYHADAYVEEKMRRGSQGVSPPPPIPRSATRNPRLTIPSNKRRLPTSRSGSESPPSSRSSRSSSSSSSSSSSRSSSSRSGSLGRSSRSTSRSPRRLGCASQSLSVVPVLSSPGEKRPLAISVKNLPPWSSDNSLKDGLFHDYKKHGKVTTVRIFGAGADRYAVVCFKKPEDAEKAYDASQDKQFFGVKIQVSPHEGLELDENEFRAYDVELDEYHQKATRTLFIGGLDKEVTAAELRKHFEPFGEIIEIDIKKQNSSTFAFCQYSDIRSVVQAVKKMDGEHLGGNRIKLGFGKSMPNRCIWIGGLAETVTEAVLFEQFGRFGLLTHRNIDRDKGHALLAYESERLASMAVTEMRGCVLGGKRLQIDYASRECQVAFFENLTKQGGYSSPSDRTWDRRDLDKYERGRRDATYIPRQLPAQRIQTYASSRSRTRYEGFEEYTSGRNFEEFADNSFERDLHEYAGRQRYENGPSSTTTHHTSTSTTLTTTSPVTAAAAVVSAATKHRGFSPARKRDEKSPHSPPRPGVTAVTTSVAASESLSPLIRPSFAEESEGRKGVVRPRSTSDHDSFHSQSPPPRGRNSSVSRVPSLSPSTPLATSPSREVTVVEDPRRRRTSEFKDLVVRVSDMRRPSDSPVRHRNNNRLQQQDIEMEEVETFPAKSEPHDPRLSLRRDETFSSGDERSLDGERVNKKPKFSDLPPAYDKSLKRNVELLEYRSRDHSPNFRKPFDSRKTVEAVKYSKKENKTPDDPLRSPQSDPRNRKTSISGGSDIEESSPWRNRDISFSSAPCDGEFLSDASPPGTPVRDEREDPPELPCSNKRPTNHTFPSQREKHTSPLSLPLPKFAQQTRPHLSPRGACASPRASGLLRSPTFNTGANWNVPCVEVNHTVEESDPILADTPVSPGPAMHDSPSDTEESPSVSPSNTAVDLDKRIKALDEKYDKWAVSARVIGKSLSKSSASVCEGNAKMMTGHTRKKRILDLEELKSQQPSDIMKSLLSKRSVFDEDSERLENVSDKYEPRPFSSMPRSKGYSSLISSISYSTVSPATPYFNTFPNVITCTTIPIPSATPLNSLPGIRRLSASSSVSSPQMTRTPSTSSAPSIAASQMHSVASTTPTNSSTTASRGTNVKPIVTSEGGGVQATVTVSVTSSSSQSLTSSVAVSTSVVSSASVVHSRRASSGSSVSTPGPPTLDSSKTDTPPVSLPARTSDAVVTVSPDTKVSGAVSVIQTSCSKVIPLTTTTQSVPTSSVLVSSSLVDSSSKSKAVVAETHVDAITTQASCEKKVLKEKELQNSSNVETKVHHKENSLAFDSSKNRIKDMYHHNSSLKTTNETGFKIKSENSSSVKIKIENPEPTPTTTVEVNQLEVGSVHKRRLSSTTDTESPDKRSKSLKEIKQEPKHVVEPDSKKLKLDQEEEKENKSTKITAREKDNSKSERRERIKSVKKEETREIQEEKFTNHIISPPLTAAIVPEVCDVKYDTKHRKEDRPDVKEKLESAKLVEVKEEKTRENEKEKKRERHEEKEKSHHNMDSKHLPKNVHSEKHKNVEKGNDKKMEKEEEKKESKMVDVKEPKVEEREEKRRDIREDIKIERREDKEEKLREYEKKRHSEDSMKSREDKKERSRDRREKDKIRDRERHRSSVSHSDRDCDRERSRDREKEKLRVPDRMKEKSKQRHSKPSPKSSEQRGKHGINKHSDKRERKESLSSTVTPVEHLNMNSVSDKSSKKTQMRPTKHNSQSSMEHDEETELANSSLSSGHKSERSHQTLSSKTRDVTEKPELDSSFQERVNKDSLVRKKHDSGKNEDKSKSHSVRKSPHYLKSKSASLGDDDDRGERGDSEYLSSDDDSKVKSPLQPAKRTKQRATSSSSGSRRGRPKNKSILDTDSETADSESDSEHKPKKPSYFDITIYDGNMYDKVKARRVKLEQKRDDDSKQQELKQKLLMQQRSKRSRKAQTNSCSAIASESEETDNDLPKKRNHARIPSSSEDDAFIRERTNHLSSEESDALSLSGKREKSKKTPKDYKIRHPSSKISHVSDITTDEETAAVHPPRPPSGTESESEHRIRKETLKVESDSEMSETGSRKPPRPALSVSRARVRDKDHKSIRLSSDKTHLKENRFMADNEIALMSEEIRHMKPKSRNDTVCEKSSNKVPLSDKRKYNDINSTHKDKGTREGRMKAIFGLMSDDSDSNAPSSNLSLTPADLISTTSYRKGSGSSVASSEPPNMTPPMQVHQQPTLFESDIDEDFRPATPDIPSQKKLPSPFETTEAAKNDLHHSEFKSSFIGHNIKEILQQESPMTKEDILSPSWREVREQTVKEVVCEASRGASDSGKGSSCGVSTTSSSSGSCAEELLLLEASSSASFREETENIVEKSTAPKTFSFSRDPSIKEGAPRKDKKKKKKHKDKDSSRSHRHSSVGKDPSGQRSQLSDKSTLHSDDNTSRSSHHSKSSSAREGSGGQMHSSRKEKTTQPCNNNNNNDDSPNVIELNILEEQPDVELNTPTKYEEKEVIPDIKKSPPLDMPIIKPEVEARTEVNNSFTLNSTSKPDIIPEDVLDKSSNFHESDKSLKTESQTALSTQPEPRQEPPEVTVEVNESDRNTSIGEPATSARKVSRDQESAVQSIATASTKTDSVYDEEVPEPPCSPVDNNSAGESAAKPSRSTISQEETLNAVAGLLACYNDYQEDASSPTATDEEPVLHTEPPAPLEDPTDQYEEAQKAAQMLQSEIGVGRETEERDENWVEALPLPEPTENVEPPQVTLSPQTSEASTTSPPTVTTKKDTESLHTPTKVVNSTPVKETPLQFPDSPSSVQSEPALQIDEDEHIEPLDAGISEEKMIQDMSVKAGDKSSVWNTPESDNQEGKLPLIDEAIPPKTDETPTDRLADDESTKSDAVISLDDKDDLILNTSNESEVHSEKDKSESSVIKSLEESINKEESHLDSEEPAADCKIMQESSVIQDSSPLPESCPAKMEIDDVKSDLPEPVPVVEADTLKSEAASPQNLKSEVNEPVEVNDEQKTDSHPESKQKLEETPLVPLEEEVLPVKEENVSLFDCKPKDMNDETHPSEPSTIKHDHQFSENVKIDEPSPKEPLKDPESEETPKPLTDQPTKDENITNDSPLDVKDVLTIKPESDAKSEQVGEARTSVNRGRSRGRGRRGGRRLTESSSSSLQSTSSAIITRSSVSTRYSKNRGRGRGTRTADTGTEIVTPEQPRRSTRQKRARKHPDMVEHDEATNRRRRNARGGKVSGEEAALRATLSSSDVYDFHDSDEDEVGVALTGKKGKKDVTKPPTPNRSPVKAADESNPEIQTDPANVRKSRRLREKPPDEDAVPGAASEGEQESENPPAPYTRSRVRGKKDDTDDEVCNTPRKSPRSRAKLNDSETEGERNIIGVNETPVGQVSIQKVEQPLPTTTTTTTTTAATTTAVSPTITVPPKTIIIPCTSAKPFTTTNVPVFTSQSQPPTMSLNAVPAVYSSNISSHPVKLSIVPSGVRTIGKGTPVTCVMAPQAPSAIPNPNPSLLTVTSVPVSSQVTRAAVPSQPPSFTVTSAKDPTSSPLKTVVSINCSPLSSSAFKAFPNGKKPDTIPTPLVDPVTGHLTPMKISDEGHYIPIGEHLSIPAKDKMGLTQQLHQTKILRAVLPSSISVTTVTNSSVAVSIPSTSVSTLVSSNRPLSLSNLPKGVAVTSLPRGREVSVELVSRTRPPVPPTTTANILLSTQKGLPNFNPKSQITLSSTSAHSPTNLIPNSVISSHGNPSPQVNTPSLVTITTPNKHFPSSNTTAIANAPVPARGPPITGPITHVKGSLPAKLQPIPTAKVTGNAAPNLNVQSIILNSPAAPLHSTHRSDYPQQVMSGALPQQTLASSAGSIGTVSVSRIPSNRNNPGPTHEPPSHIPEYISLGVPPRYPDPTPRFREPPVVEVARLPGAAPAALSPIARGHEPEAAHMSSKPHFELHHGAPSAHNRQGVRSSSSASLTPHVQPAVPPKAGIPHYYGEMHKKAATPQPLSVVPPGVGVERYLASPPLHTPPNTQTPPPAHHNQRENLQINPIYHRGPYIVSDPRAVYGEKIANLAPMPIDLKVIEKSHPGEKVNQEEKERPGSGPISLTEYTTSRPPTVITPHNPSSPHHLPSPHYDRSTDSPQVTMMYNRRYPHYDANIFPNRAGTPGIEHDSLPRSPAPLQYAPIPPEHSPRVQITGPQFPAQVSPQLPPQTDNLQYLLQNYPVMWDGMLGLKNEQASVKMHFISGSMEVARGALPEGSTSLIRISQRMRLEQSQLEGVARKMQMNAEHCILMALPYGRNHYDQMQQQMSLETGFIKYLGEDKRAAGIVNVHLPGSQQSAYVIHIFPPCDFANENLIRIAPDLLHGFANMARLLVVIATC